MSVGGIDRGGCHSRVRTRSVRGPACPLLRRTHPHCSHSVLIETPVAAPRRRRRARALAGRAVVLVCRSLVAARSRLAEVEQGACGRRSRVPLALRAIQLYIAVNYR